LGPSRSQREPIGASSVLVDVAPLARPSQRRHAGRKLRRWTPGRAHPPPHDQGRLTPLRANYCLRYRPAARQPEAIELGEPITVSAEQFERLSKAFLAELDAKFVH
jgi:hypothetical protein